MALERHQILVGNTFRLALETGQQLRLDWVDSAGATQTATVTAASDEASYEPQAAGTFYLATRESATDDWCRYGALDVVALADATEEQLVRELANVNALIANSHTELVQYQHSDASGTAVTRMTLRRLLETRGLLETRLADYRRRKVGGYPLRLT